MKSGTKEKGLPKRIRLRGHYQIKKMISQSELSIVYTARQLGSKHTRIIKEFFPRALTLRDLDNKTVFCRLPSLQDKYNDLMKAFLREADIIKGLNHPNFVSYVDFFEENGTAYLVMNYCEGMTLDRYIQETEQLYTAEVIEKTWLPLANALDHLHKEGVIHRDIKPSNIIISPSGTPILIDFGSAILMSQEGKGDKQTIVTTAGYSPLEFYSEKAKQDARSDLYSFAATLFFYINRSAPTDVTQRLFEHRFDGIHLPSSIVTPMLARVIRWGLAVQADKRCPTLKWFKHALYAEAFIWKSRERLLPASKQKTAASTSSSQKLH
ncbi:serine/threonine protein kinase [Brevibacillus laterosporus]|uniref:serine/threonine protein kinase n=1 Tax=Brevibacillus laterosporus TaxID=1465 RepID=UPI000B9AF684|nr:serine/threonine-protein kinase [Brevibacillus laterosporus]